MARMEVGHPPGAPFYLLLGRFLTLFASHPAQIAWWANLLSVLASAATVSLLYSIIAHIIRFSWPQQPAQSHRVIVPAAIGAALFAVTDTFWFSAVESEVYALSMFFTALTFWCILQWEAEWLKGGRGLRWIVLISYLTGLSIGVHLLNLLALPVLVVIIWFRMQHFGYKEMTKALGAGFVLLAILLFVFVQKGLWPAAQLELWFVNSIGLPFQSGLIFYLILVFGGLFAMVFRTRTRNSLMHFLTVNLLVFLIGYGSYAMILIRAQANPSINLNDPSHVFAFESFMNREQYGDRPLLYGPSFNATPLETITKKAFRPVETQYETYNKITGYRYQSDDYGILPRMHSAQEHHVYGYNYWAGINPEQKERPGLFENLRYFFNYQFDFMYVRYFMWNFAGRQNDIQGNGEAQNGNWISGIQPLDALRLGNRTVIHPDESQNAAHNRYYLIPLLVGVAGIAFMARGNRETKQYLREVLLLLLMTGPAIVFYLNQTPYEPRERDYAFVGSFFAFSIFIGLGVYALMDRAAQHRLKIWRRITPALLILALPIWVGFQNFDDHDRSHRQFDLKMAKSYLESCAPHAILFTYGDNDTYPLWYAQEVEGIRPDVRVVNFGLMGADWCIGQLTRATAQTAPIPFGIDANRYREGDLDNALLLDQTKDYLDLASVIQFIGSNQKASKLDLRNGQSIDYSPGRRFSLATPAGDTMRWELKKEILYKNDIAMLDLLAHNRWERPIYFTSGGDTGMMMGLDAYTRNDGLVIQLDPAKASAQPRDAFKAYEVFMHKIDLGDGTHARYDHFVQRTFDVMQYRTMTNRIAGDLLKNGDRQRATKVLHKSIKELPVSNYAAHAGNIEMLELLHACNLTAELEQSASLLTEYHIQVLRHYASQKNSNKSPFNYAWQDALRQGLELQKMLRTTQQNNLLKNVETIYGQLGIKP